MLEINPKFGTMKMLQLGCPPHPGWSTFFVCSFLREWTLPCGSDPQRRRQGNGAGTSVRLSSSSTSDPTHHPIDRYPHSSCRRPVPQVGHLPPLPPHHRSPPASPPSAPTPVNRCCRRF